LAKGCCNAVVHKRYASRCMARPYFGTFKPLLFAHRGGAKRWPENTLLAFQSAIDLGFRYIETDVHQSSDGHFVCFHDATLERTTDGHGRIADHSLAELRRLDAAHHFLRDGVHPYRGGAVGIPTLEEALELTEDLHLNVELKAGDAATAKALFELLTHHGVEERVLVAAEKDALGAAFAKYNRGRIATSPGFYGVLDFWAKARLGLANRSTFSFDALQVPQSFHFLQVVTPRFVEAAHRQGLQVHVWTVDEPERMRQLLSMGVDGLMTDVPDVLMEVAQPWLDRDGPRTGSNEQAVVR
jgi:glycerophosphoryl diester phosphodiesterase